MLYFFHKSDFSNDKGAYNYTFPAFSPYFSRKNKALSIIHYFSSNPFQRNQKTIDIMVKIP